MSEISTQQLATALAKDKLRISIVMAFTFIVSMAPVLWRDDIKYKHTITINPQYQEYTALGYRIPEAINSYARTMNDTILNTLLRAQLVTNSELAENCSLVNQPPRSIQVYVANGILEVSVNDSLDKELGKLCVETVVQDVLKVFVNRVNALKFSVKFVTPEFLFDDELNELKIFMELLDRPIEASGLIVFGTTEYQRPSSRRGFLESLLLSTISSSIVGFLTLCLLAFRATNPTRAD